MNHEKYIVECIKSVIEQTYSNIEIVYLDNASQDKTYEIGTRLLGESEISFTKEKREKSYNISQNVNYLLSKAKGKYISFLSADDFIEQKKIEIQVREFSRLDESWGVIYSDAYVCDTSSERKDELFIKHHLGKDEDLTQDIYPLLLRQNFIPGMSCLIKKACFDRVGQYDEDLVYEDFDMWLRMSRLFKFHFSDYISCNYRITPGSASRSLGSKAIVSVIETYYKQLPYPIYHRTIIDRIKVFTNDLYQMNDSAAFRIYAWRFLKKSFDLKTLLFLISDYIGIKFPFYKQFLSDTKLRTT